MLIGRVLERRIDEVERALDRKQIFDGHSEFYDQDVVNGRFVFTRFVWTATTTRSPHFEQSISADGGKSWELNWATDQTKD